MPGYVIHLSIAEEYLRKHPNDSEEYDEFIKGVCAPDKVKNKSLTHYSKGGDSSKCNLVNFFKFNSIKTSFNRGYFLHLLTDYIFYNRYMEYDVAVYDEYDILNEYLIKKYNVSIPDYVDKRYIQFKSNGKLKYLSKEMIDKFIEEVSSYNLNELRLEILENQEYWTKIKNRPHKE